MVARADGRRTDNRARSRRGAPSARAGRAGRTRRSSACRRSSTASAAPSSSSSTTALTNQGCWRRRAASVPRARTRAAVPMSRAGAIAAQHAQPAPRFAPTPRGLGSALLLPGTSCAPRPLVSCVTTSSRATPRRRDRHVCELNPGRGTGQVTAGSRQLAAAEDAAVRLPSALTRSGTTTTRRVGRRIDAQEERADHEQPTPVSDEPNKGEEMREPEPASQDCARPDGETAFRDGNAHQ